MSSVKITDNTPLVKLTTRQKASIFLRLMTDEIVKTSTPGTPKKTGRLRMDIVKQVLDLRMTIIWGKDYAPIQEKTQFKNYTTPGTGPHFAENAAKKAVQSTDKIAKQAGLI